MMSHDYALASLQSQKYWTSSTRIPCRGLVNHNISCITLRGFKNNESAITNSASVE